MIQFRRGKTASWQKSKIKLADGQPGYDKDRNKLRIGDGEHAWEELPDASGLRAEEILSSEKEAKDRLKAKGAFSIIGGIIGKLLNKDDRPIITYGTESPDENTVGQIYLQHYEADPEVDYIVGAGINGYWSYQKWNSGVAKCFMTFDFTTTVQDAIGNNLLYKNSTVIEAFDYPITFIKAPSEVATVQSPGGLVWLATSGGLNTSTQTATYAILSPDKQNNATYKVSLQVEGYWK